MRTALQVSVSFKGQPVVTRIYPGDSILIGRDTDCDVRLKNLGVSRHHARIDRQGPGYLLRDMESAQGIQLGEKRVESLVIKDGDQVQITKFSLLFRVVEIADSEEDAETVRGGLGDLETMRASDIAPSTERGATASPPRGSSARVGGGRAWLLIGALLVAAGAILYFVAR